MITLACFEKLGFRITWKLINIGFRGSDEFRYELSAHDVIEYAIKNMGEDVDSLVYNLFFLLLNDCCGYEKALRIERSAVKKMVEIFN
jgi:hypothetical protein